VYIKGKANNYYNLWQNNNDTVSSPYNGAGEEFIIAQASAGKYVITSSNGGKNIKCNSAGGIDAVDTNTGSWERWSIERDQNDSVFFVNEAWGRTLQMAPGGAVAAPTSNRMSYESFQVVATNSHRYALSSFRRLPTTHYYAYYNVAAIAWRNVNSINDCAQQCKNYFSVGCHSFTFYEIGTHNGVRCKVMTQSLPAYSGGSWALSSDTSKRMIHFTR
jgi:hypothetical protein